MADLKPRTRWQRLCAGEFIYELALAIPATVAIAIQGVAATRRKPPDNDLAIGSFVCAGVLGSALLWRAISRNRKAQSDASLHALDGVLHTLHAVLTGWSAKFSQSSTRMCVFVPGKMTNEVNQRTDYIGTQDRYGEGRDMPSSKGIVGMAFRTGLAKFDSLPKHTHLIDYLTQVYGFTRAEAAEMRQDARAWAAIPVRGTGAEVRAVIFIDTDAREFFGPTNSPQRKIIEKTTIGVANFLGPK